MERPILFNGEMVRAILDGRKTETRRIVVPRRELRKQGYQVVEHKTGYDLIYKEPFVVSNGKRERGAMIDKPCTEGDILWVRETLRPAKGIMHTYIKGEVVESSDWHDGFEYKAGGYYFPDGFNESDDVYHLSEIRSEGSWHPSIHMPKEAARIFLRVKNVRVERLNDILAHAGEVAKEGIPYSDEGDIEASGLRFKELWDSTIKPADRDKYGWKANPWVWVIEFERCEKPEGWCGA